MTGKSLKKNNLIVAPKVLYVKKINIYHVLISKHNSNHEKQIILLMILNRKGWHLAVKKFSTLLRGIT